VTVAARSAKVATVPAIEMRVATAVRAGSHPHAGEDVDTGFHTHDLHQLQYAFDGVASVETATARYLLPPQQAVWLPAGLPHRTVFRDVRSVSVFFAPELVADPGDTARVLAATPVIREMVVYAARWPIYREASDPVADAYFTALAVLLGDWLEHEAPLRLPTTTDPLVQAIIDHTDAHLDSVTLDDVCRSVGVSERTLRRRFADDTGMTWRRYRLESRLLRAMVALAEHHDSVLDVATSVGFDSVSAFSRAFFQYAGETPTAYRRRVRS
jgi:AraC-like DNA-binding protein